MDVAAEDGLNPYANYSPQELINAWTIEETAVQRNVSAIGDVVKERGPTDPPVQVGHMIEPLERSIRTMELIESVVSDTLEGVRDCCCGQDKLSVITLGTSVGETGLSILAAALVIERVGTDAKEDDEGWVPFGVMVATSVATIVKNYFWEQQIEIETDLAKMNALISKDALLYVQGLLQGVRAMNEIGSETQIINARKMEERLRKIAAMPENQGLSPALIMQQVQTSGAYRRDDRAGTKTEALAQLVLGEGGTGTLSRKKKWRHSSGYHPQVSEDERRATLRMTYVTPTCCDYTVNIAALRDKAVAARRGIDKQVEGAGKSTNSDFAVVTRFLERTRDEVRDDLLYVLDWFLKEEERWRGHPVSKMRRYALNTSQYIIQLLAMASMGADAYKQQNEGKKSKELELTSLISVIGSVVLGRIIEMGNRNVQANTMRRADIRAIRGHVLKTMGQVEALVEFFKNLEGLRKRREEMTVEESQLAVLWTSRVPGRHQAIADISTRRVVTHRGGFHPDDYDASTGLGQRAAEIYGELMDGTLTHSKIDRAVSRLSLASQQSAHMMLDAYQENERQMRAALMDLLRPSVDSPKKASLRRWKSEERLNRDEYLPSSPAVSPMRRVLRDPDDQSVPRGLKGDMRRPLSGGSQESVYLTAETVPLTPLRADVPAPVLRRLDSGDVFDDTPGDLQRSRSFAAMTEAVEESMFYQLERDQLNGSPYSLSDDGFDVFLSATRVAPRMRVGSPSITSYDGAVADSRLQRVSARGRASPELIERSQFADEFRALMAPGTPREVITYSETMTALHSDARFEVQPVAERIRKRLSQSAYTPLPENPKDRWQWAISQIREQRDSHLDRDLVELATAREEEDWRAEDDIVAAPIEALTVLRRHSRRVSDGGVDLRRHISPVIDGAIHNPRESEVTLVEVDRREHRGMVTSLLDGREQWQAHRESPVSVSSGAQTPPQREFMRVEVSPTVESDDEELQLATATKVRKPFWKRVFHFGPKRVQFQRDLEPSHQEGDGKVLDLELEVMQQTMQRSREAAPVHSVEETHRVVHLQAERDEDSVVARGVTDHGQLQLVTPFDDRDGKSTVV